MTEMWKNEMAKESSWDVTWIMRWWTISMNWLERKVNVHPRNTVGLKGHHYINFSIAWKKFDVCEKIACDYVYIIILHAYIIIWHEYINILHVYIIILHVYIIKYTCIHNYPACIYNYPYMYT